MENGNEIERKITTRGKGRCRIKELFGGVVVREIKVMLCKTCNQHPCKCKKKSIYTLPPVEQKKPSTKPNAQDYWWNKEPE